MARATFNQCVWKGRTVKILAVAPAEQESRLHEAIARRAYRIFRSHGSSPGHEAEDWVQAQSEVVRPLECGFITQSDKVSICIDIAAFAEGIVEVCVEPRRLSLYGRTCSQPGRQAAVSQPDGTYRLLDLPVEVDPSHVHARFNGRILEIDLYRAPLLARAA